MAENSVKLNIDVISNEYLRKLLISYFVIHNADMLDTWRDVVETLKNYIYTELKKINCQNCFILHNNHMIQAYVIKSNIIILIEKEEINVV